MTNSEKPFEFQFLEGEVFSNIETWLNHKKRFVLITLIKVDGRSPYPVGTQLAVAENGEYCGYLTNGCAERAILFDALNKLDANEKAVELYGKGSKYIDIVLPCGSGITVLVDPTIRESDYRKMISLKESRKPFVLVNPLDATSQTVTSRDQLRDAVGSHPLDRSELIEGVFYHFFAPTPKLIVVGQGPILTSLVKLALSSGFCVDAYYDDQQEMLDHTLEGLNRFSANQLKTHLENNEANFCSFVSVFHEHEKEVDFIAAALEKPFFYIGALGSTTSHMLRVDILKEMQICEQKISRIHAPVGLPINAKTPDHIAVSILAEMVAKLPH